MDYSNISNEELEKMADNKDSNAICELAERCMYGKNGHEVNLTRAYRLLHKGEKMGLSRAYVGLGEMYRKGIYFHKNENIARDYYQKAGVPYPESVQGITAADILDKLKTAENARENEKYNSTKVLCDEICNIISNIRSGVISYQGNEDVEKLLAETYWILAYTAFNEQNYQALDDYLNKKGVLNLHPWGTYLSVIGHRNMNFDDIKIEQDLQKLLEAKKNSNLSQDERGDICAMIGDLILEGYGNSLGLTTDSAKKFYEEGMHCGNDYAKERYSDF